MLHELNHAMKFWQALIWKLSSIECFPYNYNVAHLTLLHSFLSLHCHF